MGKGVVCYGYGEGFNLVEQGLYMEQGHGDERKLHLNF